MFYEEIRVYTGGGIMKWQCSSCIDSQFDTITDLKQYAALKPEFPSPDNTVILKPDYSSFYRSQQPRELVKFWYYFLCKLGACKYISKSILWSAQPFRLLLEQITAQRESAGFKTHFIEKLVVPENSRIFVWSDLEGAFHSLTRDLCQLKAKDVISEDLKLSSDCYFIFNGNCIDRSPYILETLTVILKLLAKNPGRVFYIKGNQEDYSNWYDSGLKQALKTHAQDISSEKIPLESLIARFFNTLPLACYIASWSCPQEYMRISYNTLYGDFFNDQCTQSDKISNDFLLEKCPVKRTRFSTFEKASSYQPIKVYITGVEREHFYTPTTGLSFLIPDKGVTSWNVFSGPTYSSIKAFNFFNDAFVEVKVRQLIQDWDITLYYQDVRTCAGFKAETYNLFSGRKADAKNAKCLEIIKLGCTLDLSKSSAFLGKRLQEGIHLYMYAINYAQELGATYVRPIFLDDKYTPSIARRNVLNFLNIYHTPLIFSPLGTPTTESFLPLAEQNKILILFPYTGAQLFRKPNLTHVINFRTSYTNEAKALVQYAFNELQLKKFAFFYQDDSYGLSALEGARAMLKKLGIEEWLEASYARNNPNVASAAHSIAKFDPEVIIFFSTYAPSSSLMQLLGIPFFANKTLMGISFLTDRFREFLNNKGLKFIISRVTPNPYESSIELVRNYQEAVMKETGAKLLNVDSLEGYINSALFVEILKNIQEPVTPEKIIAFAESMKNYNLKGISLTFNPHTRELSQYLWLDLNQEDTEWLEVHIASLS